MRALACLLVVAGFASAVAAFFMADASAHRLTRRLAQNQRKLGLSRQTATIAASVFQLFARQGHFDAWAVTSSSRRTRSTSGWRLVGVIAYNLGKLRRLALPLTIQSWPLTSLQQRSSRPAGRLIGHARYFTLQLAKSYLTRPLFRQIVAQIYRLAWHPT
jgi:hypothetical protein